MIVTNGFMTNGLLADDLWQKSYLSKNIVCDHLIFEMGIVSCNAASYIFVNVDLTDIAIKITANDVFWESIESIQSQ